jgi:hypothetical protein
MCQMTDTGSRWKREIELPAFGESRVWWAVKYRDETRYTPAPPPYMERDVRAFMKPLYAVRVTARSI